jgi:hypothetical protein
MAPAVFPKITPTPSEMCTAHPGGHPGCCRLCEVCEVPILEADLIRVGHEARHWEGVEDDESFDVDPAITAPLSSSASSGHYRGSWSNTVQVRSIPF